MLTAVIVSTTAKPSVIFARNRNVGILIDLIGIARSQARFPSAISAPKLPTTN